MGLQADPHVGQCREDGVGKREEAALEFAYAQSGLNIVYDLDIKDRWVHAIARPERG